MRADWAQVLHFDGAMAEDPTFRHLGGGRKGLFLLLRYLFIVAAAYLVIFQDRALVPAHALMIAVALSSNVALSLLRPELVFAWYVEAPVLIADTWCRTGPMR